MMPRQIDQARRLVRERKATPPEIARLLEVSDRTVQRYVYEEDILGTSEPLLDPPGIDGDHWWMRGERHPNADLTTWQAAAVWRLRPSNLSAPEVVAALDLPVTADAVRKIWSRDNWRWLTQRLEENGDPEEA